MTSFKYICFVQNLRFKAANDKCNINNIIIISSAVSQTGIFARSLGILCIFFYWTSFFMFIIKHTSYITYAQKLSKWLGMLYILDIQIFQYCAKIIELWNFLPAIPPIKIIKKESKFCITQYTYNVAYHIHPVEYLPGTPEAFGSLCTYFMCSINSSPEMQSFWQIGQQLGFGPPTNAVCCK